MKQNPLDRLVLGVDQALKTLTGQYQTHVVSPGEKVDEAELSSDEKNHAAGLMRVNHTGEICAQALYEGQALTARSERTRDLLLSSAQEEREHLGWCRQRLDELEAKPSVLDPLFYSASFVMGAVTGLAGDKISMGFVEATEDQVIQHLDDHLEDLPATDLRSRAIVERMRDEEENHGAEALAHGGVEFPSQVKSAMRLISRVMTETTYRG